MDPEDENDPTYILELRNCTTCGSTLSVERVVTTTTFPVQHSVERDAAVWLLNKRRKVCVSTIPAGST